MPAGGTPHAGPGTPGAVIACRLACYRPHEALAPGQLRELGVGCVEVRLPPGADAPEAGAWAAAEAARLAGFGLEVTSVHGDLDLTRSDTAAQVAGLAPALRALGCRLFFVALRPLAVPREAQWARLRAAGEAAADAGLAITLEMHPDLTPNAVCALETLGQVGHPAVRLNFDTANVYFYNRGLDCVTELRRVAGLVASVHLKDTPGGFGERCFPALGEGVVDFAGVFRVLDEIGFCGPCTIEVEGGAGEARTRAAVCGRIAASVAYLRRLGRL